MTFHSANTIPLPFFEGYTIEAALSSAPPVPGETVVHLKPGRFSAHSQEQLTPALDFVHQAVNIVKAALDVGRVGLVATSDDNVGLIPFHGLSAEWRPTSDLNEEYNISSPGYISSKNGPGSSNPTLDKMQRDITRGNIPAPDFTYLGNGGDEDAAGSIFVKIIRGEIEQWRVWESASHVAFLTLFGNTTGFTVRVSRKPLGSDIFAMAEPDLRDLAAAISDF